MIGIIGKAEIHISIAHNGGFVIATNAYSEETLVQSDTNRRSVLTKAMNMPLGQASAQKQEVFTTNNVDDAIAIIKDKLLELQG